MGKCKDCKHWQQYSGGKMKCSFYGSQPMNTNGNDDCVIDNKTSFGFKSKAVDFSTVTLFEQKIAEFFGAPFGVAVDSCTHGLELCLRYTEAGAIDCPAKTYLSIPMLANKLHIGLHWQYGYNWSNYYMITRQIADAATMWQRNGFKGFELGFMCLSFQHQKHLSLGRGGMILCDNKEAAGTLRKMSYDGRLPGIPWREQNVDTYGFHYYMTPETAALGLSKLDAAIATPAKIWDSSMYPDISKMKVFNK